MNMRSAEEWAKMALAGNQNRAAVARLFSEAMRQAEESVVSGPVVTVVIPDSVVTTDRQALAAIVQEQVKGAIAEAVAEERERCAQVADRWDAALRSTAREKLTGLPVPPHGYSTFNAIASEIRGRGNPTP